MKKIFYSLISVLILVNPTLALAKIGSSSAALQRQAKISQVQDQRVNDLKQRADTEIDRRITALNGLITQVGTLKKLTNAQKAEFSSSIQTQINFLNSLKIKIDADTDLTTLKADVKSIIDSYRIFLVFMPQIRFLAAADRLSVVASDLNTVSAKLQARINNSQALGKDVTQLSLWISDLNSKTADAQSLSNSITEEVISLTPQGYPGNKTTLEDARSKLKTGEADVKIARQDGLSIISQLKLWGNTAVTPTP